MMKRWSVGIFTLLILSSCWLEAATYYIHSKGNDNNSGTSISEAWASISKVNRMTFYPGDKILFEGGKAFQGSIYFTARNRGTADRPIIVGSFGNGQAIIRSGNDTGLRVYNTAGFHIQNLVFEGSGRELNIGSGIEFFMDLENQHLDYIGIDGVDVSGYRHSGIIVGSWKGSSGFSNISITNSKAHNNGEVGIATFAEAILGHKNLYVGNCKAYDNSGLPEKTDGHSGNGIMLGGVDGGVIEYNEAFNNGWLNAWQSGGPVGIWAYRSNNLIFQYNESHNNKTGTTKDGGGFDVDGGCTNVIMQYNYSHDNEGAGYLVAQYHNAAPMNNIVIRHNISENDGRANGYGAIHLWSTGASGGIRGLDIYNNSVYLGPTEGRNAPKAVFVQSGGMHDVRFINNIFQTTGGVRLLQSPSSSGLSFEGNNYWASGDKTEISWGGTTYSSLAAWHKDSGQEQRDGKPTGSEIDPQFENPGQGIRIGDPKLLYTLSGYKLKETTGLLNYSVHLNDYGIDVGDKDFWGNSLAQVDRLVPGAHQLASGNNLNDPEDKIEEEVEEEDNAGDEGEIGEEGAGLVYSYYEGKWETIPDFSILEPKKQGRVSGFSLEPREKSDFFAFLYEGYITISTAGVYTFYVNSDDGSRLFINGSMVVDNDGTHGAIEKSGKITLAAGSHSIKVEYFEAWGGETLEVRYLGPGISKQIIPTSVLTPSLSVPPYSPPTSSLPPPSSTPLENGLSYSYFHGNWSQLPDFTKLVPKKQGNINGFSLEPREQDNFFAFLFEGFINISTDGEYTFYVNSDDGSRLFINGSMVLDNDGTHGEIEKSGKINLAVGSHSIRVEYFEAWGGETLEVRYQGPGLPKQIIPTSALTSSLSAAPPTSSLPPPPSTNLENGLSYSYYHGKWSQLPEFSNLVPRKQGVINELSLEPREQDNFFAFLYEGYIRIASAGAYTFYLTSDDGSKLFIGGKMLIDNDGTHSAIEKSASLQLAAGDHPIRLEYFESWGGEHLELNYKGPGIAKQSVPASILYRSPNSISATTTSLAANRSDKSLESFLSNKGGEYILYPNPVMGELNIKVDVVPGSPIAYVVYDIHGTILIEGELKGEDGRVDEVVDLQTLSAGVYFIKFHGKNEGVVSKSIIKL